MWVIDYSWTNQYPQYGKSAATVRKAAYTKARRKLQHTAFIKLNQRRRGEKSFEYPGDALHLSCANNKLAMTVSLVYF